MADFVASPWYSDIVYVLRNLQAPEGLSKSRARSIKLKAAEFCILNQYLYWKDPGGVLLNFFLENESHQMVKEFHKGDCGGHHSWKVTTKKILRAGFIGHHCFQTCTKKLAHVINVRFFMVRER